MRIWHWLFRGRTPRRAEPRTSPYRTAPDKLPGAPPSPPPEARTSLPDLPDPPARPVRAQGATNWGLLLTIVGLIVKLVSAASSSSAHTAASPDQELFRFFDGSRSATPAPATTGAPGNQAPAWQSPQEVVPPRKAAEASSPSSTASATAKRSPAATSSATLHSSTSPTVTKPLTTSTPLR
jgi:hypothetical protein